MDIDYAAIAAREVTIHDQSGVEHTYKLRRMDALMQLTLPRQMTKAYQRVTGKAPETDAEVQAWFSEWSDTPAGTAFCLNVAFEPLGGAPSIGDVLAEGPLESDDLAKVIFGMNAFFSNGTGSSSKPTGSARRSPKRPARTRKASTAKGR